MKFTPRTQSGERLEIDVDPGLLAKFKKGGKWSAVVTDKKTGKTYAVRGAECGLPGCFCDAEVIVETCQGVSTP